MKKKMKTKHFLLQRFAEYDKKSRTFSGISKIIST